MRRTELLISRAGIQTYWHKDHDGQTIIETRQDVEPILELNKKKANENLKKTHGRDMFPVASIPVVIQYEWLKRYGVNIYDPDQEREVKRLLNDPEWRYLRTSEIYL
jgi:hypothetical protein